MAKNTQLKRNLQKQAEIYARASDANAAIKVIVYFTIEELARVRVILEKLNLGDSPHVRSEISHQDQSLDRDKPE